MQSSRYHIGQNGIAAAKFQRALGLLIEAAEYANQTSSSPWEFATEIRQLGRLGLCENDLRFLVRMRFVDHASEVTIAGNCGRQFQSSGELYFTDQTCFVLTPRGFAAAAIIFNTPEDVSAASSSIPVSSTLQHLAPQIPTWDRARHLLIFDGQIIKQFKWQAVNQEAVLSAFQEEGWPARIDDPLAPMPALDAKRRLSDTIKCLNRNQQNPLVRFRGDGTGQGVIWNAATWNKPAVPVVFSGNRVARAVPPDTRPSRSKFS
jgi:hypothetical protein